MQITEIRKIAMGHGIKTSTLTKSDLIRAIQLHEGNFDCFGSAVGGECDQLSCVWREDCLPKPKAKATAPKKKVVKKAATKKKAVKKAAPKKKATKKKAGTK